MKKNNYTVINSETGEFIDIADKAIMKSKGKISKYIVDDMLKKAEKLEDIDMDLLYTWLKITHAFNKFNQVKLFGNYISMDFIALSRDNITQFGYASRLLEITHTFTNILMKNQRTWISTWAELYDELGITSKNTQSLFKKFCEINDLVRVDKGLRTKDANKFTTRLIVNPYMLRKSSHIGQVAIARYVDLAKGAVNTDSYALKYLEFSGVI